MSILIYVRYSKIRLKELIFLENSSQRAYFRSCDENTATPLADKREIGRFMGFLCPIERFDLYAVFIRLAKNHISALNFKTSEAIATDLMRISLLKESFLCVKFYIHKIDSISVFVMKLKRILISAKGYLGGESLTTIIDKIT